MTLAFSRRDPHSFKYQYTRVEEIHDAEIVIEVQSSEVEALIKRAFHSSLGQSGRGGIRIRLLERVKISGEPSHPPLEVIPARTA